MIVDLARIERPADVLFDEAEAGLAREMTEVGGIAGAQVVDSNDGVAFSK